MKFNQTTAPTTGATPGSPSPLTDLDASGNPNYPAAVKGDRYRITVAGKVGGASGKVVEAGDVIEAVSDNAGGTEAAVGTSWIAMQANIAGMTAAGLAMITAANAAAQRTALFGGYSLTGSQATSLLDLGGTWNTSGVATALKINITNTASGAGSLLFDVQANSKSVFSVSPTAVIIGRYDSFGVGTGSIGWNGQYGESFWTQFGNGSWSLGRGLGTGGGFFEISAGGANTVHLTNRASDHLGLGFASATPVAQTFGGAEGSGSDITGGTLNIGTRGTGAGTGGVINFQSHAVGSTGTALGTLVNVFSIIGPGVCRITGIPTSSAGLSSGDIYSNAGILTIVT